MKRPLAVTIALDPEKVNDLLYGHGTFPWMREAIGDWRNGGIKCRFDREGDEEGQCRGRKTLRRNSIRNGFAIMARESPFQFGQFLEDNADKITCDTFYQCAIFGKLVYA